MKTRRNMVKRWIAGVLAVTMLSSTMSTAAFAAPESTDAPETAETIQVTAWSWTDGSALTWQEDTSAWTLALSEEQTISAEADLLALLPASVEATLAQPETEATPAPESTADTDAAEVTPTPEAEVDPAVEEGPTAAAAPAAETADVPEEDTTGVAALSVESEDNEETTPAPETATPVPAASTEPAESTQPAESTEPAADAEPTEEPAAEADTETLALTWDTAALSYPLAGGDYTVTATLPEGYALAEGAPALTVAVQAPGAEDEDVPAADNSLSGSAGAYAPSMLANAKAVDTIDPVGTTINLFDYWLDEQDSDDNEFAYPQSWIPFIRPKSDGDLVNGINKNHILKFVRGAIQRDGVPLVAGGNLDTNSNNPYTGIVANKLKSGYPQLNNAYVNSTWVNFDATEFQEQEDGHKYTYDESLNYLFDPKIVSGESEYAKAFENVKGLFSLKDGYYTFDSNQNYAYLDEADNTFDIYNYTGDTPKGFFPFTDINKIDKNKDEEILANHYFGLTMTTRFVQQNDGRTTDGTNQPVTYHFSGDDDVWVFIDGVLVGDLGGIHSAASLDINFSTGEILINSVHAGTLYEKFDAAGSEGDTTWNSSKTTFANNTTHVLQLFYLERGNFNSNLELSFNMESVFESSIKNVDQNGSAIPSTEFELYATDEDYDTAGHTAFFEGETESDGVLKLKESNGQNITLKELKEKGYSNFVLKETATPAGYRSAGEVHLYFLQGVKEPILLCANPWESGAYANPAVTATLPAVVKTTDGQEIDTQNATGTFFAVVMKRKQNGQNNASGWQPVYGDPYEKGWSTLDNASKENILLAAQNSPYVFKPDNNGLRVTIDNLPGDIQKYYYILSQTSPSNADTSAEYTVAYFYREGESLQRLKTDDIDRIFSAQVCVSNVKNYLIVQQTNGDETKKLDGATYELYKDNNLAKSGDGQLLLNEEGKPYTEGDQTKASVKYDDTVTTANQSQNDHDLVTAEGSAIFPSAGNILTNGTYYIVEAKAPVGYNATKQIIKVVVNDTGVYADAGQANDDVKVLRGAGKIMGSMLQFAVPDVVNTTLTDITATRMVPAETGDPTEATQWKKADSGITELQLSYHTSKVPLEYGLSAGNGDPYFVVDEGWSRVQITQNYNDNKLMNQPDGLTDPGDKVELKKEDGTLINLTDLFSRSTVVRVKNTVKLCDLTISNTIKGTAIGNDNNQQFDVTITLTEGTMGKLEDSYKYTVGSSPEENDLTLSDVEGSEGTQPSDPVQKVGTVKMTPGQTITVKNIPFGTGFAVAAAGNVNYTAEYSVTPSTVDGEPTSDGAGTLTENGTVTITNERIMLGSVKVTNTVDGAMGSYSDTFSYTLKLYDATQDGSDPAINGTYDATLKNAEQADQPVKITFEAGEATEMTQQVAGSTAEPIKLAHGESLTISGLPAGATLMAIEAKNTMGYTVEVDATEAGTTAEKEVTGAEMVPASADADPTPTIAFTNKREAIIPTGLREENHPYIVMIGLAGMAALVGAAGWVEMRRRKRREEE